MEREITRNYSDGDMVSNNFKFHLNVQFKLLKIIQYIFQILVSIIQTYRPWTPRFDGKSRTISLDDRDDRDYQ